MSLRGFAALALVLLAGCGERAPTALWDPPANYILEDGYHWLALNPAQKQGVIDDAQTRVGRELQFEYFLTDQELAEAATSIREEQDELAIIDEMDSFYNDQGKAIRRKTMYEVYGDVIKRLGMDGSLDVQR